MDKKLAVQVIEADLKQLSQTQMGRRALLLSVPMLLASCATPQKSRYREGENTGQQTSLSVEDERKMTADYIKQMEKDYPTLKSNYAQKYINDLGHKIVNRNGLRGRPYHYNFRIVNSKQVNAFALPAGEVFVTTGLLKMTDSEAELAGVVGHEIGHIKARHTAERIHKAEKEKGKSWLYGLGGAVLGGAAGFGLGKLVCSKQDRECLARMAKYGALAGGAGGLLIQKYAFMAHSREDEMEADRIGFRTSVTAGFDSNHVGKFYEKLLIMEKRHQKKADPISRAFVDAMSTHPPSKQRVTQMQEMERNFPKKGRVSGKSYLKLKKMV
jgi:predicted Zn-dependent protease